MKIAIITGASSGLGQELAGLAAKNGEVDEIWAIARREDKLDSLAAALHLPVRSIALDLSKTGDIDKLEQIIRTEKPAIHTLINAAGFGKFGNCTDVSRKENDDMIGVNIRALVDITTMCLPYMVGGGRIMEIASVAAFMPLAGLDVYAATKAFVLSYTRALRNELHGRNIRVTAVCPGWIKTEFIAVAQDTKNGKTVRKFHFAATVEKVAAIAYAANTKNRGVISCGIPAKALRIATKILPHNFVMYLWKKVA